MRKQNRTITNQKSAAVYIAAAFLGAVCWHLVLIYGIVYFFILRTDYFMKLYTLKYDGWTSLEISENGLRKVVSAFLGYIKGSSDSAQAAVSVGGKLQPFFSEKELAHLADIREILLYAGIAASVALFIAIVLTIFFAVRARMRIMFCTWIAFIGAALCLGCCTAVWYLTNPIGMINRLHEIFFSNDLWVMSASSDRFVLLFPTGIYGDFLLGIGRGLAFFYAIGVVSWILYALLKKRIGNCETHG